MLKTAVAALISAALMFAAPAFAVDGVVLINQSTVMAAGGFPYKITQPGSYKLSGNLVAPGGGGINGIAIEVSNVTIDLNGFTISGPVTCTGLRSSISCVGSGGTGISAGVGSSGPSNVAVRNGSIVGFGTGIDLEAGVNYLVEEVQARGNSSFGLVVVYGLVRRNTASANGDGGIFAVSSTVTENVANLNGTYGLLANGGVYGSNTLDSNGTGPVISNLSPAVSQHNNGCDGVAC